MVENKLNEPIDPVRSNLPQQTLLEASIPLGSFQDANNPSKLNITIRSRQIVWLRGRSGVGKTTALRTIAHLHEAPGVEMKYRGNTFDQIGPRRWRSAMLYVNQKPVLFRGSVRENIFRPFTLRLHKDRTPGIGSVTKLLKKLDLSDSVLERDAMTLSVGEAARICLIRSLLLTPDILLLDEPTASLDLDSRKAVAGTLKEWLLITDGGIIGVTHDETLTEMAPGLEIDLGSC